MVPIEDPINVNSSPSFNSCSEISFLLRKLIVADDSLMADTLTTPPSLLKNWALYLALPVFHDYILTNPLDNFLLGQNRFH
jgi:hypothetical protein